MLTSRNLIAIFTLICVLMQRLNGLANAAVFTQPALITTTNPNKCFNQLTQRFMLPDKEYKPKGICAVMSCDIKAEQINIETCPQIDMPGCEELPVDTSWTFPKCCPHFKCTDFKTGKDFIVYA